MSWPDIAILAIIGISAVISLFRGFVREVLSLAAWVVAFWVAFTFTEQFAKLLEAYIALPSMRSLAAFIVLLIGTLFAIGIVNYLIGKIIDSTGLSGTDRVLGVVFGVVRGVAVVGILVLLAGATPAPQDPWWKESLFLGHFQRLAEYSLQYLPPDFAKHFSYSQIT